MRTILDSKLGLRVNVQMEGFNGMYCLLKGLGTEWGVRVARVWLAKEPRPETGTEYNSPIKLIWDWIQEKIWLI